MNIIVKEISFDRRTEMIGRGSGEFISSEIDNVIITFRANNNKVRMNGSLTVGREEFEENVTNLEQMIKGYILG